MDKIITIILVTIGLVLFSFENRPEEVPIARYDSIVVLKVQGLTANQYQNVSKALDSNANTIVEYVCSWSGVMVVKLLNSTISSKGDAQMYIRTRIGKASPGSSVQFLHVYVEQSSGSTKC